MGELIHMVMDDFAQIYKSTLVQLEGGFCGHLKAGCMNDAQIAQVISAILADDDELALPELLVIGDNIMVAIALTNFELCLVSRDSYLEVAEFVGVNTREFEEKFAFLLRVGEHCEGNAPQVHSYASLLFCHVPALRSSDLHSIDVRSIADLVGFGELVLTDEFVLLGGGNL